MGNFFGAPCKKQCKGRENILTAVVFSCTLFSPDVIILFENLGKNQGKFCGNTSCVRGYRVKYHIIYNCKYVVVFRKFQCICSLNNYFQMPEHFCFHDHPFGPCFFGDKGPIPKYGHIDFSVGIEKISLFMKEMMLGHLYLVSQTIKSLKNFLTDSLFQGSYVQL